MAYQPKEGSFSLFKNDRKTTDSHPDYTGSILIDGKEYWISGWKKEGKRGVFISGQKGKLKEQSNFTPRGNDEMPKHTIEDDNLSVPF